MRPRIDREPAEALSTFGTSMRRSNPSSRDRRRILPAFIIRGSSFRVHPDARGIIAGSASKRAQARVSDLQHFKERQVVECFINKTKHFCRIATPYDMTAQTFPSVARVARLTVYLK